jgi:hypothetical protein
MKNKGIHLFIISTFVLLYLVVSVISTIHVVDFFQITNPKWLSVFLAIAFEIGAAASLASIIVLDKMNKFIVWSLFFILTAMQAIGNTYFAYTHLSDFTAWSELFGISEEEPIFQKRVLAIISGAILPLVSLGFIKALVDYIRPEEDQEKKEDGIIKEEIEESEEEIQELNLIEEEKQDLIEIEKIEEKPRKLKDTVYYDLDPTKIS